MTPKSLFIADAPTFLSRDAGQGARRSRAVVREGGRDARQRSRAAGAATRASPATRSRRPAARPTRRVTIVEHDRQAARVGAHERARRREPASAPSISPSVWRSSRRRIRRSCRSSGRRRTRRSNGYFETHRGPRTRGARGGGEARRSSAPRQAGKAAGDVFVAGFLEANAGARAIATSRGLFAYHRTTRRDLSTTARTPDGTGSGWASARRARLERRSIRRRSARTAAQKAVASRNPEAIEPGLYTVVLEPQAVAELVPQLVGAFNARANDEGRSRSRKRAAARSSARRSRTSASRSTPIRPTRICSRSRSTPKGLPLERDVWIENGVLKNFSYARFWAQKQGKDADGRRWWRRRWRWRRWIRWRLAGGLKMVGGTKSDRRADRRVRARHSRHALLLHPTRSIRARCCSPASRATARS